MPANPLGVALRNRRAGHRTLVWARPDLRAPENFALTSPAFDHGAPIPGKHRGGLLPAGFALDAVIAVIAGHAIGRARLDGTYEIR
jgi:hypothetical protein